MRGSKPFISANSLGVSITELHLISFPPDNSRAKGTFALNTGRWKKCQKWELRS